MTCLRTKKLCETCNRIISLSNYNRHTNSCHGPPLPKKIRGIDFNPNWGYKSGIRTAWNKGKKTGIVTRGVPNHELFVENSNHSRSIVKARLLKCEIIPYVCDECGNDGEWNGKELSLHLDHRNGVWDDHRIKNLRFLCPNCHSQTETYAGKRKNYKKCPRSLTGKTSDSKSEIASLNLARDAKTKG